jgi:hypothetical protein
MFQTSPQAYAEQIHKNDNVLENNAPNYLIESYMTHHVMVSIYDLPDTESLLIICDSVMNVVSAMNPTVITLKLWQKIR